MTYFLDMLGMYRHVIEIYEYIIQIDYDIDIQNIKKKIIHKLLKSYESIGKTK